MSSKRLIVAELGDIHANCMFALMRPGIQLPPMDDLQDSWSPHATHSQLWIWEQYTKHIDDLKHLAGKDEIVVLVGGDITHGKHFPDKERVSVRQYDDFAIAADALGELAQLKNVKRMRLVKGTGSHVYGHGTAELVVARILEAEYGINAKVAHHYLLTIRGVHFDIAHHGPGPGVRKWLRGNVLRLYVRSIVMSAIMEQEQVPDILLRWHFHRYVPDTHEFRSNGKTYITRSRICPSYSYIDDHARKVAKSPTKLTVGMLAFEIVNGKVKDDHEFLSTIDLRRKEVLE